MRNLLNTIKNYLENKKRVNYRDRRGHYASSGLKCLRDQYWELKGEPPTNKTDMLGMMRMLVGDAVERQLVKDIFENLHWFGYHPIGGQIAVGTSNPDINGYLDYMLAVKEGDTFNPFVIEVKTKSGYGADLFMGTFEPSQDYMSQLGLYLREMTEKKVTSNGMFLYVLLSDKYFGHIVQLNCRYDAATDQIVCYEGMASDGSYKKLNYTYKVGDTLARFKKLDEHLANNIIPEPDYKYKYDLTEDFITKLSDYKLRRMINREALGGDWQPLYSKYKDKQLEVDGTPLERTDEEIGILRAEYLRRHPKSKI